MNLKEKFMNEALKQAKKAFEQLEVPVGAIIVKNGKIIGRGYNQKEYKCDVTKHAEIIAIQKASKKLNNWRLTDCEMYVTLEPCNMCAGAIIQSRIKKVYIGTMDDKSGCCGSICNLMSDYRFNYNVEQENGILENKCKKILKDFFVEIRKQKVKNNKKDS